jgi:Mg-chelatase subunit ChlD
MKTLKYILILISLSLYVPANGKELISTDVMVVIDNSASMKKNDPGFLLKQALTTFADNLQGDTYTGFILFSDNVDMVMALKPLKNDSAQIKLEMVTNLINYSGMHTSIPAAIEKAYYELKVNGRKGSDKLIIFLTDGIVDLPDNAKNDEKSRWLKEVITEDCKNEKIKIFSIAFTEQADFELLQTLSSKTGGSYYRAQ